jgi:Polyketide cyclase / dehydrase and lipid transport
MTFVAKHMSVSINRPATQVYEFASNPENLPKWAAGLSGSIKKVHEGWIAEAPMGRVKVKFAENNKFGVLDHDVTLPSGVKVYNPMRVFPNNDGSELVFTLYRRPEVSDQEFAEDAKAVERDLRRLKTLLKNRFPSINEIADTARCRAIDPLSNIFVLESHQQLGF